MSAMGLQKNEANIVTVGELVVAEATHMPAPMRRQTSPYKADMLRRPLSQDLSRAERITIMRADLIFVDIIPSTSSFPQPT
jgi:hypothetical protein